MNIIITIAINYYNILKIYILADEGGFPMSLNFNKTESNMLNIIEILRLNACNKLC